MSNDWHERVKKNILNLMSLKENHDSYGARRVSAASIACASVALDAIALVNGIPEPRVGASPDGHVTLSWEWDDFNQELDIAFDDAGTVRYAYTNEAESMCDREGEITGALSLFTHLMMGNPVVQE